MRSLLFIIVSLQSILSFANADACRNPFEGLTSFYINSKTGCDDGCPQNMALSDREFDVSTAAGFMLEGCCGAQKFLDTYHGKISQGGGTYDFISYYSAPSNNVAWPKAAIYSCEGSIIGYVDPTPQTIPINGTEVTCDFVFYDALNNLIAYLPANQDQKDAFNIYDAARNQNIVVTGLRSQTDAVDDDGCGRQAWYLNQLDESFDMRLAAYLVAFSETENRLNCANTNPSDQNCEVATPLRDVTDDETEEMVAILGVSTALTLATAIGTMVYACKLKSKLRTGYNQVSIGGADQL